MYIKSPEGKKIEIDDDLIDLENPYEEAPTKLESGLRGAAQGLTLGFPDEIEAAGSSVLEDMKRLLAGEVDGNPVTFDEQGIPVIPEDSGKGYRDNLESVRKEYSDAEKANPGTYLTGELAGGILPGLATGGAAAVGNVLKTGALQAAKQSAKLGAKYGAVSGAGYSEADNPLDLVKDIAVGTGSGAAIGGAIPLLGKGAVEAGKRSSKTVKSGSNWFFDLIPKSEQIKTAYNWGKLGKKLDIDVVDKEMMKRAGEFAEALGIKKDKYNIDEVMKKADDMGIKVDSREILEEAIDSIKKMQKGDWFNLQNKDFLPNLMEMVGTSKQSVKMNNAANKKALKKLLEGKSKEQQAIIKGEKALAKEQIKSGDSLETITDVNRPMNDLELPLDTQDGIIGGVKGKFKNADGTERVVSKLDDVTPFQPEISNQIGPDRRPIVLTKDAGSGKVEALVGEAEDMLSVDPSNFTISELDDVVKRINKATKLASGQGSADDPVVLRARKLAVDLRAQADEAAKASGIPELVERRAIHSNLFAGEDKLGISGVKGVRKDVYDEDVVEQIADKLSYDRGFKDRRDIERAGRYLGDDVMTPELEDSFKMLRKVNEIMGRGDIENISKSGLYEMASTGISNTVGRGAKVVSDTASKIVSPVTKTSKIMSEMGSERLKKIGSSMVASESEGAAVLGNRLIEALAMKGQGKNAAMWSLSQNPAFRSLVDREVINLTKDMLDFMGASQGDIDPSLISNTPYDDGSNKQMMYVEDDTSEGEEVKDVGREPDAMLDKKQTEAMLETLTKLESGGDIKVINPLGYAGKYQFGAQALEDVGYLKIGSYKKYKNKALQMPELYTKKDGLNNIEDYLSDEAMQDEVAKAYFTRNYNLLKRKGVDLDNLPASEVAGLLMESHIAGAGGTAKRYKKGIDSEDAFGTKGSKYYEKGKESIEELEKQAEEAEKEVDRVLQQQSSGDMSPISQLDSLLEKINNMSISQEDKDVLEDEAVAMEGHSDGNRLKDMIREINGLS